MLCENLKRRCDYILSFFNENNPFQKTLDLLIESLNSACKGDLEDAAVYTLKVVTTMQGGRFWLYYAYALKAHLKNKGFNGWENVRKKLNAKEKLFMDFILANKGGV